MMITSESQTSAWWLQKSSKFSEQELEETQSSIGSLKTSNCPSSSEMRKFLQAIKHEVA